MFFLVTLNMASSNNNLVHQVTIEHPAKTCEEFCELLNNDIFIVVKQYYFERGSELRDMGKMILNVEHVGKVVEYIAPRHVATDAYPPPGTRIGRRLTLS